MARYRNPGARARGSCLYHQARLLAALADGAATMGDLMARLDVPSRLGPSYGWAAVQLQAQGKIVRSSKKPYVWSLATEATPPQARTVDGVQLAWERRQTVGLTWRWELSATAPGAPRWCAVLPGDASPELRDAAERRAIAQLRARGAA